VPQRELVRLALADGRLVIDPSSDLSLGLSLGSRSGPGPGATPTGVSPGQGIAGSCDLALGHRTRSPQRGRLPGRGAYVHARVACITAAGLSRSFRRQLGSGDVSRIVAEMSPTHDNSTRGGVAEGLAKTSDQTLQNASQNAPGLEDGDTVEMPPRIKAKDDRSEDARL
jgi:hypothetical protein